MAPAGTALIHVGHGARPRRVFNMQVCEIKAGKTNEVIYLPVKMTTAGDAAPGRRDAVLPVLDIWLGRQSVFDKVEISVWFEYPPYFAQGGEWVRDRTECPGHHHAINGGVL